MQSELGRQAIELFNQELDRLDGRHVGVEIDVQTRGLADAYKNKLGREGLERYQGDYGIRPETYTPPPPTPRDAGNIPQGTTTINHNTFNISNPDVSAVAETVADEISRRGGIQQ
jgi:hypothetical protein